jgi:hypothetical protein
MGGQRRQRLARAIFHANGADGYRLLGTIQKALDNKPMPPMLLRRCGRDVSPTGAVALQDWRSARGFHWPNLKKYHRALVVCTMLRCREGKIKNLANVRALPGGGGVPIICQGIPGHHPPFLDLSPFFFSVSHHFWCRFPYFLQESFVCLKVSFSTKFKSKSLSRQKFKSN